MSVYIIAEVGSTHGGSLGNAMQSVATFANLGANAIKFQDHYDQTVDSQAQHPPWFQGPRNIHTRRTYLWETCLAADEWATLASYCKQHSVDYVCSPFSLRAAQRQAPLVDRWKVASGQVTNIPMLEFIATTGKPVIVSMGLATPLEERAAWEIVGKNGTLMTCSSLYPCPPEFGLRGLHVYECDGGEEDLRLSAPGLSDHTEGLAACLGAVALGATVLEKHVTLSRHLYGSDARWAMEPQEFRQLVLEVRALEAMLKPRDEAEYRKRVAETRAAFMHGGEQ